MGLDQRVTRPSEAGGLRGSAGQGRLQRLFELLAVAVSLTTVLSSAGTVAGLLGM
ncbi:hypothetical protein OIE62_00810 [Streptomyces scopuliridis]|uniref:Uncharacterized protein n=1 Tax=Streptomyces scopuliridis TaxID=452529 RepID=A0ACD4ZWT0_9ACTN|nr:hypothetical protein [Streptomyces scopuliridis]WSB38309.1 hypothetical protein OG949_39500 [Streptomyces scopuliridis]WSC02748.1 hypothetical protein OG835_41025 [Streptomyces scopuliridis]WSC03719.1 hypothetical protein OIE62_00810 [Streptomyces scopuliridis]